MKNLHSILMLLLALILIACQPTTEDQAETATNDVPSIEGTWFRHIDEFNGPDTSYTRTNVAPCVMIFTPRYYSDTGRFDGERRPLIAEDMSEIEKLRIMSSYHANSGTYTLTDSTVTLQYITNMHPNYMQGKQFQHLSNQIRK